MVRFIMRRSNRVASTRFLIYIPIWLDLLSEDDSLSNRDDSDLHSNMVRFIMQLLEQNILLDLNIYIPIWLDLLYSADNDDFFNAVKFTFQYG